MPQRKHPITKEYLSKGHGIFLLKLLRTISRKKPMNMYELRKEMKCSYPQIHRSIKQLRTAGFLWTSKKKKTKHEADVMELSVFGLWMLVQSDPNINKYWNRIKEVNSDHLKVYMDYFELFIYFGYVDNEYCNLDSYNYPTPAMIAKSLVFFKIGENNGYVDKIYDRFIKKLTKYDYPVLRSIKKEIKKEQLNLKAFLEHSQILLKKINNLEKKKQEEYFNSI